MQKDADVVDLPGIPNNSLEARANANDPDKWTLGGMLGGSVFRELRCHSTAPTQNDRTNRPTIESNGLGCYEPGTRAFDYAAEKRKCSDVSPHEVVAEQLAKQENHPLAQCGQGPVWDGPGHAQRQPPPEGGGYS